MILPSKPKIREKKKTKTDFLMIFILDPPLHK